MLAFLENPMIPSDNNGSERGIRKRKIMLFNFYQTAIIVFHSLLVVAVFSFRSVWDELDFFLASPPPFTPLGSLPFTSLRSVTVGSGRGFLEGDTCRG